MRRMEYLIVKAVGEKCKRENSVYKDLVGRREYYSSLYCDENQ